MFADDNLKFDENGRKLSKWVENTVGKVEIARYEQFLLFLQCFPKACRSKASTYSYAKKGLIQGHKNRKLTLCHTIPTFNDPEKEAL